MSREELDRAMDWTTTVVHEFLAQQELDGSLLHLITKEREVDVVILESPPQVALHTARALCVVRAPSVAIMAMEAWAAEIDKERAQDDPLLRDWYRRRMAGKDAPVTDLPRDYIFELLVLAGESTDGAQQTRHWRIDGVLPRRTFRPYTPNAIPAPDPLPLFIHRQAAREGIGAQELRRSAQHYLARSHRFEPLVESTQLDDAP